MENKRMYIYEATEFNNIREIIKNAVKKHPENKAFILKEKKDKEIIYKDITYKQFDEDIDGLGTALINMGLKGKRIAIIGKNRYEWILSYLSVINGTGIVVPLDKGLPEAEIESSLVRSKADCIIFESSYIEMISNIKANNKTNVSKFICMDDDQEEFTKLSELISKGKKLLEEGNNTFITSTINATEMSILLFTSGTTSASKAVMLSHKNIASNICAMTRCEDIRSTDSNIAFLPFHHTFGCTGILMFLSAGATNVFCDGLRYIQKNLVEYKVSTFVCVPLLIESIYKKIMQEIDKTGQTKKVEFGLKLSKILLKFGIDVRRKIFKQIIDKLGGEIRMVISGASGIDPKVAEGFRNFGIYVAQGYGLTETSPVIAAELTKQKRLGSIGKKFPSVEVKIDNPDKEGVGELLAKGNSVMLGYYNNDEANEEVFTKDGWFCTGDLARIDKNGYIYISGRKKFVIVLKNGKNVYPEEIESLIEKNDLIKECMVFGMPARDGDVTLSVKVCYDKDYVKNKFGDITKEEISKKVWDWVKEVNQTMPKYKYVKKLVLTDEELVKTTTLKIKRNVEMKKIMENN